MNEWIKTIIREGIAPELHPDATGTDVRVGSTNGMANSAGVSMSHVIMRGGWDLSGINKVFEYMLQVTTSVSIGGRALAGWPNPRLPCYPATVTCVRNESNQEQMDALQGLLFSSFNFSKWNLDALRDMLYASLLLAGGVISAEDAADEDGDEE